MPPKSRSLVPLPAPRPHGIPEKRRSRPTSGTETTRNPRKPTVSSHFRHRDHTESPKTDSLVPLPTPRPRGIPGNRQSRPFSGTETTRNRRKPTVSSHPRHRDPSEPSKPTVSSHFWHRDLAESPETGGLVPLPAPKPHRIPRNRQSRPTSGTETTRNDRKPAVSSLLRHRDHTDSPETGSLVPPSAPRLHRVAAEGAGPRCFWGKAPRKCKKCCRRGK